MLPLHTPRERRPHATNLFALVAQLAQQGSCKAPFVGSTPTQSSIGASSNWTRKSDFHSENAGSFPVAPSIHHIHSSSSAAEQLLYTEMREGASPSWSTTETIRLDEDPVLKTGARKGCRCKSIPFPPFSRSSSAAEQPADNGTIVSANLTSWSNASLCQCRATMLKTSWMGMQVPREAPFAPLRQCRAVALKTQRLGMRVPRGVYAAVRQCRANSLRNCWMVVRVHSAAKSFREVSHDEF